jgi:GNAT superfamily N-acetyltransferase
MRPSTRATSGPGFVAAGPNWTIGSEIALRLPRYRAVPAALIGRLARDERFKGKGLGEGLLVDALRRILDVGGNLAVYAVVVEAKDSASAAFYLKYGFTPFPSRPLRLFLTTDCVKEAVKRSGR